MESVHIAQCVATIEYGDNANYMYIHITIFRNLLLLSCNLIGPSEVTK